MFPIEALSLVGTILGIGAAIDQFFVEDLERERIEVFLKDAPSEGPFKKIIGFINDVCFQRYFSGAPLSWRFISASSIVSVISFSLISFYYLEKDQDFLSFLDFSVLGLFTILFLFLSNLFVDMLSIYQTKTFFGFAQKSPNASNIIIIAFSDLMITFNGFIFIFAFPIAFVLFIAMPRDVEMIWLAQEEVELTSLDILPSSMTINAVDPRWVTSGAQWKMAMMPHIDKIESGTRPVSSIVFIYTNKDKLRFAFDESIDLKFKNGSLNLASEGALSKGEIQERLKIISRDDFLTSYMFRDSEKTERFFLVSGEVSLDYENFKTIAFLYTSAFFGLDRIEAGFPNNIFDYHYNFRLIDIKARFDEFFASNSVQFVDCVDDDIFLVSSISDGNVEQCESYAVVDFSRSLRSVSYYTVEDGSIWFFNIPISIFFATTLFSTFMVYFVGFSLIFCLYFLRSKLFASPRIRTKIARHPFLFTSLCLSFLSLFV